MAKPGVIDAMRATGVLPVLLAGERDCPTCQARGWIACTYGPHTCPTCAGARKVQELRTAWATGKGIALSLDERCSPRRVEGHVQKVSATNAFVVIEGWHVPGEAILAVHNPSRLGDSSFKDGKGERWNSQPRQVQRQEEELLA